ncbi:hypothetical protein BC831DRAFT_427148 [Entophlyctis helioformis]|nr:hypothetical protein BC831DRAFT_427148 [Entophlyctis helioformis]
MSPARRFFGLDTPPGTLATITGSRLLRSPKTLAIFRLVVAIYVLASGLLAVSLAPTVYFRFLTNLSWMGIAAYFFVASFASFYALKHGPSAQAPKGLVWTVENLFSLSYCLSWVVSLIFWTLLVGVLATSSPMQFYIRVNAHALNFVFMQADLWLNNIPVPLFRVFVFTGTLFLYSGLTYLLKYAFDTPWPYPFFNALDIKDKPAPAVVGILIFTFIFTIVFVLAWAEARLRDSILNRRVAAAAVHAESDTEAAGTQAKETATGAPSIA